MPAFHRAAVTGRRHSMISKGSQDYGLVSMFVVDIQVAILTTSAHSLVYCTL